MKIAILGYGNIGSGVYDLLNKQKDIQVKYIYIRKGKEKTLPEMCDDYTVILEDPQVDVIVECMGGLHPAYEMLCEAMMHHKHIVSANKNVIATYQKKFQSLAKQYDVQFLCEASCGGGIPFLHEIKRCSRMDTIEKIEGIFNGTCNYILDQMERNALPFDKVLQNAQCLGYAEKDPSDDIDGFDTAYKLRIAAGLAFDTLIEEDFPIYGIRTLCANDIAFFKKEGYHLRLYAQAIQKDCTYACAVEPVLINKDQLAANTRNNFNICCMKSESLGEFMLYGQGAGKYPTAHAVVQDLIDLNQQIKTTTYASKVLTNNQQLLQGSYMIRASIKWKKLLTPILDHMEFYQDECYYITKKLDIVTAHEYLDAITKQEHNSFYARIKED